MYAWTQARIHSTVSAEMIKHQAFRPAASHGQRAPVPCRHVALIRRLYRPCRPSVCSRKLDLEVRPCHRRQWHCAIASAQPSAPAVYVVAAIHYSYLKCFPIYLHSFDHQGERAAGVKACAARRGSAGALGAAVWRGVRCLMFGRTIGVPQAQQPVCGQSTEFPAGGFSACLLLYFARQGSTVSDAALAANTTHNSLT